MKNNPKIKSLIGTKFLFDEDLISYKDLVELMEKTEVFDTRFIQKPIKDESEVHSIYIKPEFEVAYLGKSPSADEYYKTAGYSCVVYKEVNLQTVLDVLGYTVHEIQEPQKEIKPNKHKKQKYISILDDKGEYIIRKKNISYIYYNKVLKKLYIRLKNTCIEDIYIAEDEYIRIKDSLES